MAKRELMPNLNLENIYYLNYFLLAVYGHINLCGVKTSITLTTCEQMYIRRRP